MVSSRLVVAAEYRFKDLVEDITSRCTTLSYLIETTIRLRYLDDEDNWINLNFEDDRSFAQLWQCARLVPDREFKRVKLQAVALDSPLTGKM